MRPVARRIVVGLLALAQILWCGINECPMGSPEMIWYGVVLVIGAGTAVLSRPRWLQAIGFGFLLLDPSISALMTAVLGSVAPYGRTGIEVFGVFGFAVAGAFVCGYWLNRWLGAFESGLESRPLSTRGLFVTLLLLCSLSILGAMGELLLRVSYPDGLVPMDTLWGQAMVWVMMFSAPAMLTGPGLLVFAAPVAVHLVRTRGPASGVGRAAIAVGLLALVCAAVTLNR